MTQREFAEHIGLATSGARTVGRWERGEAKPSPQHLSRVEESKRALRRKSIGTDRFRFIDLFAGVGGIRLPFQELGGRCVFSSEWDKFAQQTYMANYGELPLGDITQIAATEIPPHEVLLAGFPCQAFSQAGRRLGFQDTRGTLFFEIQRILAHHKPEVVFLENVKQLVGHDRGRTLRTILDVLTGDGAGVESGQLELPTETRESLRSTLNYEVGYRVLRARDFGVPQNRERVYIVALNRDKVPKAAARLAAIFDEIEQWHRDSSLADILMPNEEVDEKYTISDRLLAGHERRLREHRKKGNGFGFSVFTRDADYVNTISARYYKDGSEVLIDQSDLGKNPRKLTPRECARLQGFPEHFKLDAVSDVQAYKQMGNSVAVPVIRALATKIVEEMWGDGVDEERTPVAEHEMAAPSC